MQKKILIVGEAYGEQEEREGRAFVGPSGQVLYGMLRAANIDPRQCHFTNTFNLRPRDNKLEWLCGTKAEALAGWPQLGNKLWVRQEFAGELQRLWDEIEYHRPNVIIALGATALWALAKQTSIKRVRGTPIETFKGGFKIMPTWHPSAVMRQWKLRPVTIADLTKALAESSFPEIRRPKRTIYIPETIRDIEDFIRRFIPPGIALSTDIETKGNTITEIGFAPSPSEALVIPFYCRKNVNYWPSLQMEVEVWKIVRRLCEEHPMVGQNFSYDLQYLWMRNHIACRRIADDTMILHHAMYPEMEKGLGFLGSIYTTEPAWKFMRQDQETLKKED